MKLIRIILLAVLLLATGTTASAKKTDTNGTVRKNIMRIVKSNRFIIPHMNMSSCTSLSRKSREILTSIFKQGKTCWNIRYAYFQMLTTRTCKWIYGCMMPTA